MISYLPREVISDSIYRIGPYEVNKRRLEKSPSLTAIPHDLQCQVCLPYGLADYLARDLFRKQKPSLIRISCIVNKAKSVYQIEKNHSITGHMRYVTSRPRNEADQTSTALGCHRKQLDSKNLDENINIRQFSVVL